MRPLLPALLAALLPLGAQACEPMAPDHVPVDRPIQTFSNGVFLDAAGDDAWNFLIGGPVRDIGGGRLGQVIESDWGCEVAQRLLVVDCTTAEAILVTGLPTPAQEWGGPDDRQAVYLSTTALQHPRGPLALSARTTVAEVAALAAAQGWEVEEDVEGFAGERGPLNAFDPFAACAAYYPGTPGASR